MLGNVMLLDDDPFCNRMNTFVIEQQQAARAIITFEVALEALHYLEGMVLAEREDGFPDVILLDLHMNYMDGWGFLDRFSTFPPRYRKTTNIYILTSSLLASDREKATLHPDVEGYIEKPLRASDINFIISNQLTQKMQY
jgi:CheY-like chemotaxis protein